MKVSLRLLLGFESLDLEIQSLLESLPESGGLDPISRRNSDPARPHSGPEVFAWTLRALSGVLKASPGLLGHVSERVPAGTGKKDLP